MSSRLVRFLGLTALCLVVFPRPSLAQNQLHPRWEQTGLDFSPDGGWRVKAQRVAASRHQLMASKNYSALNAPMIGASSMNTAVRGTLKVPTVFFAYSDTKAEFMRDPKQYADTLFGPSGGNPYTLRTYYEEMSDQQFHLDGRVMGWVRLANPEASYMGGTSCTGNPFGTTNCNGIWSNSAVTAMQNGFREALAALDTTDFGQFDNDGPDGNPNSGDDDGVVDMIMFGHPTRDGACGGTGNNHIWSHRYQLVNAGLGRQDYVTNDAAASNRNGYPQIHIRDYFATSALGGSPPRTDPRVSPCDTTEIMPIGTAAHEFGHALGLPDLYDTGFSTEGIGSMGLMGSGNFTASWSPSRMESWSLNELGWITVVPITSATPSATYRLGAAPVADTAFRVDVQGSNPRNEYFLIDNRQSSQADTALIRTLCARSGQSPPACTGGLMIWHADQTQINGHGFRAGDNSVNVGVVHGLRLMQADGRGQLDDPNATGSQRRGDAGDVYPGTSGNTAFGPRNNPNPSKNVDGSFAGFAIDQIAQVVPGGEMAFRVRFGGLTIVQAALDTNAIVQVDGAPFNVFRDLLDPGVHTISIANQTTADGRRRFTFQSWSDGGLATHTISPGLAGGTFTASVIRDYKLIAMATSAGTIAADTTIDPAGTFFRVGRAVQLTATPDPGKQFFGWSGDITSGNTVITAPMDRPYTVTANFADALTTANVVAHLLGPTQPLTAGQIQFLDARGNANGLFDIGDFLAWVKATGAPVPSAVMTQLQGGARR